MTDDYYNPPNDDLLMEIAELYDLEIDLLYKLIDYEATKVHLERRPGAKDGIRKMIEDWLESPE